MDRFIYFLFVVTNVMLCVLVTVDMYQSKKALEDITVQFRTINDIAIKFNSDIQGLDRHINDVHYRIKDFSNFPPQFSGEKNNIDNH